jgi:general L-amino acid transport system permease protein
MEGIAAKARLLVQTLVQTWRNPKAWVDAAYDPRTRAAVFQALLLLALIFFAYEVVSNTAANLKKQNIASGFGFLNRAAGFEISQTLVSYSSKSSYVAAFMVGLTNTLLVSFAGIVLATLLGFMIGVARLSPNWLVAKLALTYVEIVRNVPLLLQLLVWYVAVLRALPLPQQSLALGAGSFVDVRGLHLPRLIFQSGILPVLIALLMGAAGALYLRSLAARKKLETGETTPIVARSAGLILGLPLLALIVGGFPSLDFPRLGLYNFEGGLTIEPEFMALLLGLTIYTASFIAEIVRSGISGVSRGQWEAANALGLARGDTLRLVIIPQAMRIIIPPLTNQYLNLTKNSSLAVAIGYPDLVSVFSGTVLIKQGKPWRSS